MLIESYLPWIFACLVLGYILDMLIGDPAWIYNRISHPVVIIGRLIAFLDRKLNRPKRSARALQFRGGLVVFIIAGLAAGVGYSLHVAFFTLGYSGILMEALVISMFLAGKGLGQAVKNIFIALQSGTREDVNSALQGLVSRDAKKLDIHGVIRSAIETLAENFSDAVIAPIFWYLILGLPGIIAYKAINTMDSMIGYKNASYIDFGRCAAKLDDFVNWVPARISILFIILPCIVIRRLSFKGAVSYPFIYARKHCSPNGGWPEACFAGALNIMLGGPRHYPGEGTRGEWIGDGRMKLELKDLQQSLLLFRSACDTILLSLLGLNIYFISAFL